MNDPCGPAAYVSPIHAISLQRLRDWRYFTDYMFELCPGLAYVVTKVDQETQHGTIHSADMWGQYQNRG